MSSRPKSAGDPTSGEYFSDVDTPHVAQTNANRRSAIDRRTTRHPRYAVLMRIRKRIEEIFSWAKTNGNLASPGIDGRTA
jgi:hypothetical protein